MLAPGPPKKSRMTGREHPSCRRLAGREFGPTTIWDVGPELVIRHATRARKKTLGQSPSAAQNARGQKLALAELEAFPGALLPVLLPLTHARVAGHKTVAAQANPQIRIEL